MPKPSPMPKPGKPINGTQGDDNDLVGTVNPDKINGKGGNDTIFGDLGNDNIDGGKGIDTSVYSGDYEDYTFVFNGPGHGPHGAGPRALDIMVSGGDGVDQLRNVEWLQFDDATVNVANGAVYRADAEIDISATENQAGNEPINGDGNDEENYAIVRNDAEGVELGLQIKYRQSPVDIDPQSAFYDTDGTLHFQVADGPQSADNGSQVPPNASTYAAWSFDYSIATGLNGETTGLDDFDFKLLIDIDPTTETDYLTLTLAPGGNAQNTSGFQWLAPDGTPVIADDKGVAGEVTQNSQNLKFYLGLIDADPSTPVHEPYSFGPGQFDIELQAFDGASVVASNHVVVDVIA